MVKRALELHAVWFITIFSSILSTCLMAYNWDRQLILFLKIMKTVSQSFRSTSSVIQNGMHSKLSRTFWRWANGPPSLWNCTLTIICRFPMPSNSTYLMKRLPHSAMQYPPSKLWDPNGKSIKLNTPKQHTLYSLALINLPIIKVKLNICVGNGYIIYHYIHCLILHINHSHWSFSEVGLVSRP